MEHFRNEVQQGQDFFIKVEMGRPTIVAAGGNQGGPKSTTIRQNVVDKRTISTEFLNMDGVLVRRSVEQFTVDIFEGTTAANRKILRFVNDSVEDENIQSFTNIKNMDMFRCTKCSKPFKRSDQLKRHSKIHEGGSFRCDICSAAFRYKIGLTKHRIAAHQ